jgi:hypothetical protein
MGTLAPPSPWIPGPPPHATPRPTEGLALTVTAAMGRNSQVALESPHTEHCPWSRNSVEDTFPLGVSRLPLPPPQPAGVAVTGESLCLPCPCPPPALTGRGSHCLPPSWAQVATSLPDASPSCRWTLCPASPTTFSLGLCCLPFSLYFCSVCCSFYPRLSVPLFQSVCHSQSWSLFLSLFLSLSLVRSF